MAIVKMKRLHVLALESDRDTLFDQLQQLGCVEVAQQTDKLADPQWASLVHPDESALADQQTKLETARDALSALDRYAPVKTKLLAPLPQIKASQLFDDEALSRSMQTAQEIVEYDRNLSGVYDQIQKEHAILATLAPWLTLDVPLNTQPSGVLYTAFGMIPAALDLEAVRKDLSLHADTSALYEASTDGDMHYLFFLCHRSQQEEALDVLKFYGFSTTTFKGITGTARETTAMHQANLNTLEQKRDSLLETLASYKDKRGAVELAIDRLTQEVQKESCKLELLATDKTFLLDGWVSEPQIPALTQLLDNMGCAYDLAEPAQEEYPEVPVKLQSGTVVSSLNTVTNMYSLPAYGSVDPNPLMAPFFIFFYGMMMADMGYGLLMFFGCLLVIKKKHLRGEKAQFFRLFQYCGVATFLFGAITGSFFGDLIPKLTEMVTGTAVTLPSLFSPLDDALAVLLGSLVLGVIQIFTGMAVSMYNKIRRGQVLDALCSEGAWYLVFVLGGVAALTGAVKPCIIAILVLLVLTQGYGKKGIGGKLMGIFGSLYNNVTGYFSDILSYSRLMALMLAGAVIAQVFNTLGTLTGNVILFFVISMVGNALNMALNLLGCYVHDMRLQCLEFFGRFYEDGGKPFTPVKIDTDYVDVIS